MAKKYKSQKSRTLDRLKDHLTDHVRKHHFYEADNYDFIHQRVDEAYSVFEKERRDGTPVLFAESIAYNTLLAGLEVSFYDVVLEIMENEFPDVIPTDEKDLTDLIIEDMALYLEPIFPKESANLTYEWLESEDGYAFKSELTGRIFLYFEDRDLQ